MLIAAYKVYNYLRKCLNILVLVYCLVGYLDLDRMKVVNILFVVILLLKMIMITNWVLRVDIILM